MIAIAIDELKTREQWLAWRWETNKDGEPTKVPYQATNENRASSTDPETWNPYVIAEKNYKRLGYEGLGFVVTANDPYCGIDLDHCRDSETGVIEAWATAIVERFDSYTEITPSGTGLRIWIRGTLPLGGNRKGQVELYDRGRYFTITDQHLDGTPTTIRERSEELALFHAELFPPKPQLAPRLPSQPNSLADRDLLEKARAAKHGDEFSALFDRGDVSAYDGDDSRADLALCGMLAFWTGGDVGRVDQLFRQSALMREKWERRDYSERTIAEAISGRSDFYQAKSNGAAALRVVPPTQGALTAGTLSEAGGDELVQSTGTLADLPYLPFLGVTGYLIRGFSHLVAGPPRVGKTDLLVALVREWLDAGKSVLYITEEPRMIWEARLGGWPGDWSGLRVVFGLGAEVDALRARACNGRENVVIVDALRNLLQLKDEKDNSEIARAVNPWIADQRATEKTLVMAHHNRKGGGDHGEAIAGGHALLGSFDIAIEVLRDVNQARNRRLLRTYARLIESREAVYERVETSPPSIDSPVGGFRFRLLGDPKALRLDDVANRLLLNMTAEFQTTKEHHEGLSDPRPSLEQVRQALMALAHKGSILRDPPISAGKVTGKTSRWAGLTPADNLNLQRSSYMDGGEVGGVPDPTRCPSCGKSDYLPLGGGRRRCTCGGEW